MYEDFFGLQQRPFSTVPSADNFVGLAPLQDALDSLVHCITQARGIAVVTSAPGMGKTTLCRRLAFLLQHNCRSIFVNAGGMETRLGLLQAILFELNKGYVGLTEQEARLKLLQAARDVKANRQSLLLIFDEAHVLSPRLFEELRTLSDYAPDGDNLIQVVLCGSFELEEKLTDPALTAFSQRIGLQICLEPLTLEDSARLIGERLQQCGQPHLLSVMTEEALEMICRASDGNLRCLSQLTDHACLLAFTNEQRPLDGNTVRSALENLKELPLRWNDVPGEQMIAAQHDESWSDHLSGISGPGSDAMATSRPKSIPVTDQETDEFPIPDFLRMKSTSDQAETSPSEMSHDEPADVPQTPLKMSDFVTPPDFAVFEVGAGVPESTTPFNPQLIDAEDTALVEDDLVEIYEFPPRAYYGSLTIDEQTLPEMTDIVVVDRYAMLDRMLELPEDRRHLVDLPELDFVQETPEPVREPVTVQDPQPVSISEEDVLELVQQIRKSVQDQLGPVTHPVRPVPPPHVQPESFGNPPADEPVLESTSTAPEAPTAETSIRRFADLFTRLRQRRRKLESENESR